MEHIPEYDGENHQRELFNIWLAVQDFKVKLNLKEAIKLINYYETADTEFNNLCKLHFNLEDGNTINTVLNVCNVDDYTEFINELKEMHLIPLNIVGNPSEFQEVYNLGQELQLIKNIEQELSHNKGVY